MIDPILEEIRRAKRENDYEIENEPDKWQNRIHAIQEKYKDRLIQPGDFKKRSHDAG